MNCNQLDGEQVSVFFDVSIPNRDFDELQYLGALGDRANVIVSIPNRDFDELQSNRWEG